MQDRSHFQDVWTRTSVNNARIAVKAGASGQDLMDALGGTARVGRGQEVKDVSLKWLRSSAATARTEGVEHLDRKILAHLWADALLSEGQCAKLLGIDLLDFREICNDLDLHQYA